MKPIRGLPAPGNGQGRVETGPVQFGDDWPGTFIRGDDSFRFKCSIDLLMEWMQQQDDAPWIAANCMQALASLFDQSNLVSREWRERATQKEPTAAVLAAGQPEEAAAVEEAAGGDQGG